MPELIDFEILKNDLNKLKVSIIDQAIIEESDTGDIVKLIDKKIEMAVDLIEIEELKYHFRKKLYNIKIGG